MCGGDKARPYIQSEDVLMNTKSQMFESVICRIKDLAFFCSNEISNNLFMVATLFFILGICSGSMVNLFSGASPLILIPLFLLVFGFCLNKKSFLPSLITLILFFLLGNFIFTNYTQRVLCKSELVSLFENNKVESLIGVVIGDSVWNKANDSKQILQQTFPFKVDGAVLADGKIIDVNGKINVVWFNGKYDLDNIPLYGNRLKLGGLYCNTKIAGRGKYKYIFKISVRSWKCKVLKNNVFSSGITAPLHKYKAFCFYLRRETLNVFDRGLENHPNVSGVLKSIIVGRRVFLSKKLKDGLIRTGTIHIIAVSGLHAGIVAGIIIIVLKLFGCPRYRWIYFLAPILITYTLYTGARPSAVRACLMLLIYYFSYVINRKSNILSTVAISAFVILIINPIELFDLGFIFSFSTVLGLVLLFQPVYELITFEKKIDENDYIPKPHKNKSVGQKVFDFILAIFVVSVVAWLVSMPLTIHFFNRIVFVAPLVNIFVVPLTFCLILLGVLTLSSACILSCLPYVINKVSMVFVKLLEYVIYTASSCKYIMIDNVDWHNYEFLLYIPLIAIIVYYKMYKTRKAREWQERIDQKAFERENFD
jgi:ComEC/Rec2-related protein